MDVNSFISAPKIAFYSASNKWGKEKRKKEKETLDELQNCYEILA